MIEGRGGWALTFAANSSVNFGVIIEGRCTLFREGEPQIKLQAGDLIVLCGPPEYTIGTDENVLRTQAEPALAASSGGRLSVGERQGHLVKVLPGYFSLDSNNAELLTNVLPPVLRIASTDVSSLGVRAVLKMIREEAEQQLPGCDLAIAHAMDILLIRIIRHVVSQANGTSHGLVAGLADAQLAIPLRAIHRDVSYEWNITTLAALAGMSRSLFALRFRRVVGVPPFDYVLTWRMALAKDMLVTGQESLTSIAFSIGYQSVSSFSTAFKRVTGKHPSRFRKDFFRSEVGTRTARSAQQ